MLQQNILLPDIGARPPEVLLVSVLPHETRVAVAQEDKICEIHIERGSVQSLVGNIYLGTVKRVLPGMQSAFVDIGLEKAAFLHIVDITGYSGSRTRQPIGHTVFEGQKLPVQIIKDPQGAKGARLSMHLSLAGRFLVLLPHEKTLNISQRIGNADERSSLRQRLHALVPADSPHGCIIRTHAENASDSELAADWDYLLRRWRQVEENIRVSAAPALLYRDLPLHLRILRDIYGANTHKILTDSRKISAEMRDFARQYVHGAEEKIELFTGKEPFFTAFGVEKAINHALQPRVSLPFGGYLIIETTEAMTTIDVNTGGFVGHADFEETVFRTNLEACHAIARELRLRNVGGMILVDFIDMENGAHREKILQELAAALAYDRMRVTLSGFTSLGLVEITRKRARESLRHQLSTPCPACLGRGRVKSLQTVCYDILRAVLYEAQNHPHENSVRILAAPAVVEILIDEESGSLKQTAEASGKAISLSAENGCHQEQFELFFSESTL